MEIKTGKYRHFQGNLYEVIGVASGSIGEKLYQSKIYLETADLFCWTLVIVLLSIGCEKLLKILLKQIERRAAACWKRSN